MLYNGLGAFWELEEAPSTTRLDATGLISALTDNNGVGQASGLVGKCASFGGVNQCLAAADNPLVRAGGAFSVALWVQLFSKAADQTLICKGAGIGFSAPAIYRIWYSAGSDRFEAWISRGTSFTASTVTANAFGSPALNTWYPIILTYANRPNPSTGGDVYLSVNGLTDTVPAGSQPQTDAFELTLGCVSNARSQFLDGLLDQVGIWQKVLSSAEQAQYINHGRGLPYRALGGQPRIGSLYVGARM